MADEPKRPSRLIWECARCRRMVYEEHADPEAALREAVAAGKLYGVHSCDGVASGVTKLVGTGPGKPWADRKAATEAAP